MINAKRAVGREVEQTLEKPGGEEANQGSMDQAEGQEAANVKVEIFTES